jgi:type IV secretory pathway VirB10-like protein
MQGWGKGKKILAVIGGILVFGTIAGASSPAKNNTAAQPKNVTSKKAQSESSLVSPEPEPQPEPVPVPVPPPLPPAPVAKPAPAPQPQVSNNCDPNYSGCVPIASDVDCAGGSGNGPDYVVGPVQVIGSDIYGLDRDGDGIGCE